MSVQILENVLAITVIIGAVLLVSSQILTQYREYRFYKSIGWDFSVDSGVDELRVDERITTFDLNLTNWQRFCLFRPSFILVWIVVIGFMLRSLLVSFG